MRADLGHLVPVAYTASDDGRVELRARGSQGEIATFQFAIETGAPYRMRSLRVRVGG